MNYVKQYSLKKEKVDIPAIKVKRSKDAADFIRQFYFDDICIYESCFIMLLNRANVITGYVKISQGGISGTVIDRIIIAKYAIESLAKGVILCHNHPSQDLKPSPQDLAITQRVKEALNLFDILLVDHLILNEKDFYSFADEGVL